MSLIKQYLHNKMNESDLFTLKENYANLIVDGMDIDTLAQFAYDSIMDNLKDYEEKDIEAEITDLYGEETLNDLLPETDISELEATANNYTIGK